MDISPGVKILDRYMVEAILGDGGYGVVWKAKDEKLDQLVAIKRLHKSTAGSQSAAIDEARKSARLKHQNIVQVIEALDVDGTSLIVMEYVEGRSLADHLKNLQPAWIELDQAVQIFTDCLDAVAFAHKHFVLHRDIKPQNVLVSKSGAAKLLDFGIAVVKDGESFGAANLYTVFGARTGTLAFMSPEQAAGKRLDFTSDVFSLGILGYLLFTRRHPFIDPSGLRDAFDMIRSDDFVSEPASKANPQLPDSIGQVVDRMLRKAPGERFQTVLEALTAFRRAADPKLVCEKCGHENQIDSNFCVKCGSQLRANLSPTSAPDSKPKTAEDWAPADTNSEAGPGTTARNPDHSDEASVVTHAGFQLANADDWVGAIKKYQRAAEIDPGYPLAYANWGYALNHLGQYMDAIKVLDIAIEISEHPRSLSYRAHAYRKLNEFGQAIVDYNRAIQLDPANTKLRLNRAELLIDVGRETEAYSDVLRVLARDPQHSRALRLKEFLQGRIGQLGL